MVLLLFLAGYGWATFEALLLFVGLLSIKVAEHLSLRELLFEGIAHEIGRILRIQPSITS